VTLGDTIMIEVNCPQGTSGTVNIRTGILGESLFRKGCEILSDSTLELTEFSTTSLTGTINCNRDGLLYTSIPYDGNWIATVDGRETPITLVGDCMIALPLLKGEHTITFTYRNQAFDTGVLISLCCAAAFVGLILLSRSSPKSKGKYEK
jgi:uncharacterized membrane protein YfhO